MKNNKLLIVGTAIALAISGIAGITSHRKANALFAAEATVVRSGSSPLTTTATAINDDSHVTIKTSSANTYSNPARFYANTTITIAAVDATLVSVTYEASSTGSYVTIASEAAVSPDVTPTVNNKNVTWTFSNSPTQFTIKPTAQTRWNNISVTYAYSGSAQVVEPTGVTMSESSVVVGKGRGYKLTTSFTPGNATGDIEWSSSNDTVVDVDGNGNITGVSEGTATITAAYSESIYATCSVKVVNYGSEANPLTVAQAKTALDETGTSVTKNPLYIKGIVTGNDAFNANYDNYNGNVHLEGGFDLYRATFANGVERPANYQTANALDGYEVVVYGFGKIFNGTYELCEASEEPLKPTILQISAPENIVLTKTSITIEVDDEEQLSYSLPDGYTADDITWHSEDDSIVEVDQDGVITAKSVGTATISAQIDELTPAECEVTVIQKQNYGTLQNPITVAQAKAILDITAGEESRHPLYVRGTVASNSAYNTEHSNYDNVYLEDGFELYRPVLGTNENLPDNYQSSNSLKDYKVTAYGYGKIHNTTYELSQSSKESNTPSIKAILPPDATAIALSSETASVSVGKTITLTATLTPANAITPYTWESSDESVATVDNGAVTGVSVGTATISAVIDENIYAECEVTVTEAVAEPDVVVLDLSIDETTTASATELSWVKQAIATVLCEKGSAGTATNNYYPGTSGQSYTSTRFYKNSHLTITPSTDVTILYVEFDATTDGYATALQTSTWTNASAAIEGRVVTITPADGTTSFSAVIGATCGFTSISIYYQKPEAVIDDPSDYLSYTNSFATIHGVENVTEGAKVYNHSFEDSYFENEQAISNYYVGPVSLSGAKANNPDGNIPKYFSGDHTMRLYKGNSLTFSSVTKITAISFTFKDGYGNISNIAVGETPLGENGWSGSSNDVVLTNNSESVLRITDVHIECSETLTISSLALRFGAEIAKSDWNAINATEGWEIDDYGVMLAKKTTMNQYYNGKTIAEAYKLGERRFTDIHKGSGDEPYSVGDNFVFTVKINISQAHNIEYMAAPYIVVNGEYYFLDEMTYSVNSVAKEYLKQPSYESLSKAALSILAND